MKQESRPRHGRLAIGRGHIIHILYYYDSVLVGAWDSRLESDSLHVTQKKFKRVELNHDLIERGKKKEQKVLKK